MKSGFFQFRKVFAVVLVAGALATLAFAHNKLLKTAPAAGATLTTSPARIEMWFAEKPDLAVTKIAVKGSAGPVEIGQLRAKPGNSIAADFKSKLADGPYTVSWQTAGDDGHISKAEFGFSVKSAQ